MTTKSNGRSHRLLDRTFERLRSEFGIYAVSTGRICVAALNTKNVDYVCAAVREILGAGAR